VCFSLTKEEQTEGKKTKGKIQDWNRKSKKSYPPRTHAFITAPRQHILTKEPKI